MTVADGDSSCLSTASSAVSSEVSSATSSVASEASSLASDVASASATTYVPFLYSKRILMADSLRPPLNVLPLVSFSRVRTHVQPHLPPLPRRPLLLERQMPDLLVTALALAPLQMYNCQWPQRLLVG